MPHTSGKPYAVRVQTALYIIGLPYYVNYSIMLREGTKGRVEGETERKVEK